MSSKYSITFRHQYLLLFFLDICFSMFKYLIFRFVHLCGLCKCCAAFRKGLYQFLGKAADIATTAFMYTARYMFSLAREVQGIFAFLESFLLHQNTSSTTVDVKVWEWLDRFKKCLTTYRWRQGVQQRCKKITKLS